MQAGHGFRESIKETFILDHDYSTELWLLSISLTTAGTS